LANKPKVCIIGGFGFIGSNLLERFLASQKYEIIVFEFMNIAPKRQSHTNGVKVYYGDFQNPRDLEHVFIENQIDIVVHLICTTVPETSNANINYDIQTNLMDTVRLLDLMRKHKVNRIVFLSSGGTVYGLPKAMPFTEESPTDPICSYGITKLAIEKYLHLFHHLYGIQYLILRPSNPYGPLHTSNKQGLINVLLRKILADETITIWGNGQVVRDYIYIEDMSEIVFRLIDENVTNQIGFGNGHSILNILDILKTRFPLLRVEFQPPRGFDVRHLDMNVEKMKSLCNIPLVDINTGIDLTHKWLIKNASANIGLSNGQN
jgi:UDP-glucose 4-epimerase